MEVFEGGVRSGSKETIQEAFEPIQVRGEKGTDFKRNER